MSKAATRIAGILLALNVTVACACPDEGTDPTPQPTPTDDDDAAPTAPFTVRVEVRVAGEVREGASILQGGGEIQGTTDADGLFLATLDPRVGYSTWLIAALEGHRSEGVDVRVPTTDVIPLELTPVETDNSDYTYGPPGVDGGETTADCSHCHVRFAALFGASAHRRAASDPPVHDLFAGTASGFAGEGSCVDAGGRWLSGTRPGGDPGERCYLGVGVLPDATTGCGGPAQLSCDDPALPAGDRPTVTGACADCHAPGIEGVAGGGHSLLEATGLAYEDGVHCDFCHKVASVDPEASPGVGGRLVLGRPLEAGGFVNEFQPVMYGPYPDVLNPFMGGAWAPVFGTAEFCRGCHEYEQEPLWDDPSTALDPTRWPSGALPVHSTWSEWSVSQYADTLPCQGCHMPAIEAENSADLDLLDGLEPGVSTGFPRVPGTVRSHAFLGPEGTTPSGDRLVNTAAIVTLDATVEGDVVSASATVRNAGAGHAFPTGEPMRSAILVIDATCGGESLEPTSGDVVSAVGGAVAVGVVDTDVFVNQARLEWVEGALAAARSGGSLEVRAVRPSGAWDDYDGVPPFHADGLPPEERGRPILDPLGRSEVASMDAVGLDLDAALDLQAGDILFLARAVRRPEEGEASRGLAGLPGRDFARVLVDADGAIQAPHHRAMDVLRDDRIRPGASMQVDVAFARLDGCRDVEVAAVLVYRKFPLALARERGWEAPEIVAGTAVSTVAP